MLHYGRTMLHRLLILFIIIVLPITAIGAIFVRRAFDLQDQQNQLLFQQRLDNSMNLIDERMSAMQTTIVSLCQERDITILSSRPDDYLPFDRAMIISDYLNRISILQNSSPNVSLISLVLPAMAMKINSCIGRDASTLIQLVTEDEIQEFYNTNSKIGNRFTVFDHQISYYHQNPALLSYARSTPPRIMMRIDYDLSGICQDICKSLWGTEIYCTVLKDDQLLYATDQADLMMGLFRQTQKQPGTVSIVSEGNNAYYSTICKSQYCDADFFVCVSRKAIISSALHTRQWMLILCCIFVVALIIYSWYTYNRVQEPLNILLSGFQRMEEGDLDFEIVYVQHNEFGMLIERFNKSLRQLNAVLSQLYEQKLLTQKAVMMHLQAQINPHFLYNTFYTLDNMLLMEDHENASHLCHYLGNYFHYVTHSDKLYVPLHEEIEHCRNYLQIQQMRFHDDLDVCFPTPPEDLDDPFVPRLILQPIVENAFKHSFDHTSGRKMLTIDFRQDEENIYISIGNNGAIISPENLTKIEESVFQSSGGNDSSGLVNVHKRLCITHGTGLQFKARGEGGLYVYITLRRKLTEDELLRGHMR